MWAASGGCRRDDVQNSLRRQQQQQAHKTRLFCSYLCDVAAAAVVVAVVVIYVCIYGGCSRGWCILSDTVVESIVFVTVRVFIIAFRRTSK